ncbi:MAG: ABC transporter permease [Candidatus Caldatribacteriota bacterium]|nr:ABC transporter permease [Candidatus Caldatribacteriota bacterium]
MRGFKKYLLIEFKLFQREPEAFFFTLIFPLFLLIIFGSIYGNQPTPFFNGHGTVDVSVPAYIGIIIGITGFMNIPISVATEREKGILKRLRATPIRPLTILLGWVSMYFIVTGVGALLLIIAGKIIYNLRFGGSIINIFLAFTLSTLSFLSLGFVIASVAPTARTANIVGMIIFFPMMFLSGATFPSQMMPVVVRQISRFFPLTYVVELLQGLWFGELWADHLSGVIILLGILIMGIVVSAKTFRWE